MGAAADSRGGAATGPTLVVVGSGMDVVRLLSAVAGLRPADDRIRPDMGGRDVPRNPENRWRNSPL